MKAHTIEWTALAESRQRPLVGRPRARLRRLSGIAAHMLVASLPALAIVVGSAWMVGQESLAGYLQAAIWAAGFLFAALAIDNDESATAALQAATGLLLAALALAASRLAPELAIVASAVIAAWVAAASMKR